MYVLESQFGRVNDNDDEFVCGFFVCGCVYLCCVNSLGNLCVCVCLVSTCHNIIHKTYSYWRLVFGVVKSKVIILNIDGRLSMFAIEHICEHTLAHEGSPKSTPSAHTYTHTHRQSRQPQECASHSLSSCVRCFFVRVCVFC